MESPLFRYVARVIVSAPGLLWVYDPERQVCFFNEQIRKAVGMRHHDRNLEEMRAWNLNFDEALASAVAQIKVRPFYTVPTHIRLADGGSEWWLAHGEFVNCQVLGFKECAPTCPLPRCRVVLGVSVPMAPPNGFQI